MTVRPFMLAAIASLALAPAAHAIEWTVNSERSTLGFSGVQTGNPFQGQFRRFDAQITLDPDNLADAEIAVTIDTTSFASGSPDRDTDSRDPFWFNTGAFPQAYFSADSVTHVEANNYLALGTLTIKDIALDIELPFTLDIDGDTAIANGTITLNRIDWQVGVGGEIEDDSYIAHAVPVTIHIEATRAN